MPPYYTPGYGTPANPYRGAADPYWTPYKIGGIGLGLAGLGLSYFLSRDASKRTSEGTALQNPFTPDIWTSAPPPAPIAGLGGEKDRLTPYFTGSSNRVNQWGSVPYLIGKMRMYFAVAANAYTYTEGSNQFVAGVLTAGYGPVTITDLKVGDVATFAGFNQEYLAGFADNEPITYYDNDYEEKNISKELLANQEVIELVPQECDIISLDIEFPNGHQNNHAYVNQAGDIKYVKEQLTTSFHISYRLLGAAAWTVWNSSFNIIGNTDRTVRNNAKITLARGRYEVRVIRLTADSTTPDIVNQSNFAVLRGILKQNPIRRWNTSKGNQVRLAYLAYKAKATQKNNGVLSEINALAQRHVNVWNGSVWTMSPTQNPAWYFYDMLVGHAFDESVDAEDVDLDAVYAWAQYCDAKGWKINHIIDSPMEITEALNLVCRAGRAQWYQKDGKYSVVYDDVRATQVQHFTETNSREYIGSKTYPTIPNALAVRFLNEKNNYQPDLRIVYRDGYNQYSTGLNTEQIDMPGVTDPDLIYKIARYELAVMLLRPESAQVVTNLQHLTCNIGDKVRLCNTAGLLGLGSGLIQSVTTNGGGDITHITLSAYLSMVAGESYEVEVRLANGTFLTRAIVAVEGEFDTLQFVTPIPAATNPKPAVGDSVAFGYAGRIGMLCLVTGIEHLEDLEARIAMVPYSPGVFDADTTTVPAYDPAVSIPHESNWILPAPTYWTIRSDEQVLLRHSDGSLESRIVIALAPPSDIRITHYQYEYKLVGDENYIPGGADRIELGQVVISDVQDGQTYNVRIRHYAEPGKASEWLELSPHLVIGKSSPPPDVYSITKVANEPVVRFTAQYTPPDFLCFRAYWQLGASRDKDTAQILAAQIVNNQISVASLPKTLVSLGLVMVDVAGNESTNIKWITIDLTSITDTNLLITEHFDPLFPGVITNGTISGGDIVADDNGALMWNANVLTPMWSANDSLMMWNATYLDLIYEFDYAPPSWLGNSVFDIIARYGEEIKVFAPQGYLLTCRVLGGDSFMWVSGGDSLPMWNSNDTVLMWDTSDPFTVWQGTREGKIELINFKLIVYGGILQPVIDEVAFSIDVPDIQETLDDIEILPGGSRLPITQLYREIKNCAITLQYSGVYPDAERYLVMDKDSVSGPLIQVFDSFGASTGGIVDATIKGY